MSKQRRTTWKDEEKNLGKEPDAVIARRMGVTASAVSAYRQRNFPEIAACASEMFRRKGKPVGYVINEDQFPFDPKKDLPSIPLSLLDRQVLTEARIAKGLTQKQLAELCGVNHQMISFYESGRQRPSPVTLTRMCNSLGLEWGVMLKTTITPAKSGRRRVPRN